MSLLWRLVEVMGRFVLLCLFVPLAFMFMIVTLAVGQGRVFTDEFWDSLAKWALEPMRR
jgi:hypothetical protein